ncbi:MAG TPA: SRPBCC family protein, partial [Myxococcota bacterium]|nr:SRPBCC family protein [Myxococcota bacterium]
MRKKLRIVGAVLLGLVAVVLGVGLVLPGEWRVARSVTVDARPEIVFWFVSTLDGWNDWTAWVKKEDPSLTVTPAAGPATGVGMAYAWDSKASGAGTFTLTESVPPARVAYDLRFTDADILLHGSFVLAPAGAGTSVTWTEVGDIGHNPVARWMGVLFAGD